MYLMYSVERDGCKDELEDLQGNVMLSIYSPTRNTTLGFESVLPVGILGLLPEVLYFFSTAKSKNRTSNTTKFLL